MITKWKLDNFKSVGKFTELPLGPLTILAGANSSGKSTVIQSILLIGQTLGNRLSSRSVILNGPIVKLGQFDDLKTYGNDNKNIGIGWELRPQESKVGKVTGTSNRRLFSRYRTEVKDASCDLLIDAESEEENKELYQLQPRVISTDISWTTTNEKNKEDKYSFQIQRAKNKDNKIQGLSLESKDKALILQALDYDISFNSHTDKRLVDDVSTSKPVGGLLHHFLPRRILVDYCETQQIAQFLILAIEGRQSDRDFFDYYLMRKEAGHREDRIPAKTREVLIDALHKVTPGDHEITISFPETIMELKTYLSNHKADFPDAAKEFRKKTFHNKILNTLIEEIGERRRLKWGGWELAEIHREMSAYVEDYFISKIKYLGPLRDEPKPLYPLAGNDPSDIGIKGEQTAAVLDVNRARVISYIPSKDFQKPLIRANVLQLPLKQAIVDWLQYLDVASDVITKDRGKFGRDLKVTTKDLNIGQDLTHVGVGVSQVLPILVLCLLAEPDSTIIIEQPELHLHPKVQTLLADFFLSMALLGKQCILETHSEYIINRLRFRAASAEQDAISSLMKIYFVEKEQGYSKFRSVDVNKFGAIADWPDGFFDQSQAEAENILRAATLKRRTEMGK